MKTKQELEKNSHNTWIKNITLFVVYLFPNVANYNN